MTDHDRHRRTALGLAGVAGLAAAGSARAQAPAYMWERIRSAGEVRIGVVPGEPWFYKDLATGTWGGIGASAGEVIAHALNVKLVTVETTGANAVAWLQAEQYDVQFVLDATPHRALAVEFPLQPFFYYAQGVLLRDGVTARSWSDLDKPEVTIGVALGTAPDCDVTARSPPRSSVSRGWTSVLAFQAGQLTALCFYHPALVLMQQKSKLARWSCRSQSATRPPRPGCGESRTRRGAIGSGRRSITTRQARRRRLYETDLKARGIDPAKAPRLSVTLDAEIFAGCPAKKAQPNQNRMR
jgi:polar amino acid transport system substrate-binding protein